MKAVCALLFCLVSWALPAHGALFLKISCTGKCLRFETKEWQTKFQSAYQNITALLGVKPDEDFRVHVLFKNLHGQVGAAFTDKSIHGDSGQIILSDSLLGSWKAQEVFAHEMVHLIRHRFNPREAPWANEGLATLVETIYAGLWPYELDAALHRQKVFSLSDNPSDYRESSDSYATPFFLFYFLYTHLGRNQFLKQYVKSRATGWDAVESAAATLASEGWNFIPAEYSDRLGLWRQFALALTINDPNMGLAQLFFIDSRFKAISPEGTGKNPPIHDLLGKEWSFVFVKGNPATSFASPPPFDLHLYGVYDNEGNCRPRIIDQAGNDVQYGSSILLRAAPGGAPGRPTGVFAGAIE